MSTTIAPALKSLSLPAGSILTVTTAANSTASVVRLADVAGGEPFAPVAVSASSAPTFGPFPVPTWWRVYALTGSATDSQAPGFAADAGDFANPMAGVGDLIIGGAAGAPAVLPNPGAGTFNLQSVDGVLNWTPAV